MCKQCKQNIERCVMSRGVQQLYFTLKADLMTSEPKIDLLWIKCLYDETGITNSGRAAVFIAFLNYLGLEEGLMDYACQLVHCT